MCKIRAPSVCRIGKATDGTTGDSKEESIPFQHSTVSLRLHYRTNGHALHSSVRCRAFVSNRAFGVFETASNSLCRRAGGPSSRCKEELLLCDCKRVRLRTEYCRNAGPLRMSQLSELPLVDQSIDHVFRAPVTTADTWIDSTNAW